MTPRRLWVVSELYSPEETSTGYLLTRIAEGLAARRPVSVLCGQPTYSGRGTRAPAREERHGVAIERCAGTTLSKDHLPQRIINMLTLTASVFVRAVRRFRSGDLVLVVTNPPLLPFVTTLACKLRGARPILLIHDVYPEAIVVSGLGSPNGLVTRAVAAANRWLYGTVDRIVSLGRDMTAIAARKTGDGDRRLVLIPNWADLNDVRPLDRGANALLRDLNLGDRFVIQYAGNMGRTHGIETLVAAAESLRAGVPAAHFLFIGSGAKKAWLEREVRSRGLPNITVLGNRPRSEQALFLNACDAAVISFMPGMAGVSVPSRMYNIMAAGKPIIAVADDDSELALVVREERIGWVVPPGRADLLADAIAAAQRDRAALALMGQRARAAAESRFGLPGVIDKYEAMLASLEGAS